MKERYPLHDGRHIGGERAAGVALSLFSKIVCGIMQRDQQIVARMSPLERHTIFFDFWYILVLLAWQATVWTLALMLYEVPLSAALGVGLVVALMIAAIDIRLIAGELAYHGVLATADIPPEERTFRNGILRHLKSGIIPRVIARLAIAFMLSLTTSQAIIGFWFSKDANKIIAKEDYERNQKIKNDHKVEQDALQKRYFSDGQTRRATLNQELVRIREKIDNLVQQRNLDKQEENKWETERQRQENGYLGAKRGCKDLCWQAERERDKYAKLAEEKARSILIEEERVKQINNEINKIEELLNNNMKAYEEAYKDLKTKQENDEVKSFSSIINTHIGLQKLENDPEVGAAAKAIHWSILVSILTLELGFFIGRVFGAPSAYAVHYNNGLLIEAARSSHDAAADLAASRAARRPAIQ